jgi:hypothetical protein
MLKNKFPITLLKSLSGGIADKLLHQGISNAFDEERILKNLDSERKKRIYKVEIELLKNSDFYVNFNQNKIVPHKLELKILEDFFENWINKLKILLKNRKIIFLNVDAIFQNEKILPILQIGYTESIEIEEINIINIDFRVLIPFFETGKLKEELDFDFSKDSFIFSLIEFNKLKDSVVKFVIQELAFRPIEEPYKSLYETLNFFHFTDYIESLKRRNLYEELPESFREFIVSNEVYDLKHLTYTKLLEIFSYRDFLSVKIHNYIPKNSKTSIDDLDPEPNEIKLKLSSLKRRDSKVITVSPLWYQNQNIEDISIKMAIYFLTLQLLLKNKIPREVIMK